MSDLSIIVPTACDPSGLRLTLQALAPQQSASVDVVVVNDGGHAEISSLCQEFGVREIISATNRGSYHARNLGIQHTEGRWVGFVDAGTVPCPTWARRAIETLQDKGYVAGPIVPPPPDRTDPVQVYQYLYGFPVAHYLRHEGFAPTANLAIRRDLLMQVGPFDDRFTSGGDKELGGRVRAVAAALQSFDPERSVAHEYRSLSGLKKKIRRAAIGARQLATHLPERYRVTTVWSRRGLSLLLPPPFLNLLLARRPTQSAGGQPVDLRGFPAFTRLKVYWIAYQLRLLSLFPGVNASTRADSLEWINGKPKS